MLHSMGWMTGGFKSQQGLGVFLFTTVSILALGPTKYQGLFPLG